MELELHTIYSKDGKLQHQDRSLDILNNYLDNEPADKPLAIWVHGGLVSTKDGENAAKGLGPWLLGGTPSTVPHSPLANPVYPVFMIWETGVGHQLWDAIASVIKRYLTREGVIRILEALLGVKLESIAGGLLGAAGSDITMTEEDREIIELAIQADDRLMADLALLNQEGEASAFALQGLVEGDVNKKDVELDQKLKSLIVEYRPKDSTATALGFWNPLQVAKAVAEIMMKIGVGVLNRYRLNRAHSLKETIIEELVRMTQLTGSVWSEIKKDAAGNFAEFDNTNNPAGTHFLKAMKLLEPRLQNRPILLVGHSAGAIYSLEFLKAAAREKLNLQFHVRFLAAAATYEMGAEYFRDQDIRSRVASFRSYAMSDPLESRESLLHGAGPLKQIAILKDFYVGSLLYMVCGALERDADQPLIGMQRPLNHNRVDPKENADVSFFQSVAKDFDPKAFVWSKTAGAHPYQTQAVTHGGFGNETAEDGCLRGAVMV